VALHGLAGTGDEFIATADGSHDAHLDAAAEWATVPTSALEE
jgi:hypothetical protein